MGVQDVAFLPSRASFSSGVKALGLPHVFNLWLAVSIGMLPLRCFHSNKVFSFVSQLSCQSHEIEVSLSTVSVGDIAGYETVVSVYISVYIVAID